MTLGQLSPLDHGEDVVGELEQAETVRDGRLRCADALGDVAQREVELVDEDGEGVGPGDWVLIHVGFAMSKIDEHEARETRRMLESMGEDYEQELEDLKASIIE